MSHPWFPALIMQILSPILIAIWQDWQHRLMTVRSRRALLNLSAGQLRDVGLTEQQARREAWRPIWDMRTGTQPNVPVSAFQVGAVHAERVSGPIPTIRGVG